MTVNFHDKNFFQDRIFLSEKFLCSTSNFFFKLYVLICFRSPTFLAYAFKNHDVLADAVFTSIFRSLLSVVNLISV